MNLASAWNLNSSAWLTDGRAGTLTLRAGGNLTLSNYIGSPNDNLVNGETWNLRLVGGADLTAASPLATLAPDVGGLGSVRLTGNNAKLRTGTGSIEVAAATDFVMDAPGSVVYTAGRIGATDTAVNGNSRWSRDGGSISIAAGRDATGASNEWITEWLRRPRSANPSTPAEWWAYRPNFQQGIGTLGGGDIRIDAGHDVSNLSAMLPTTGRSSVDIDGVLSLDVQGGGDLGLRAGNDVNGGSYLIGRGDALIAAGGSVGTTTPIQLFVMGVSSGDVSDRAAVAVTAGGSIELQSVNNPTVLLQLAATPGQGPSFGQGPQRAMTYFSYAANSKVDLLAQSGDVKIGSQMTAARRFGGSTQTLSDSTVSGAFPASLVASAFEGNVSLGLTRPIVTYPSASAQVALLAGGSVLDPNLTVSDLSADGVKDASRPVLDQRSYSGDDLLPKAAASRIVDRPAIAGFRFDLQSLTGDVGGSGADASVLSLPAMSRVRAGRDVRNVSLTVQNLSAADRSEVRADSGDVSPAGLEIRGPGSLLIQAGRHIDAGASAIIAGSSNLGGIIATGNNANPSLASSDAARMTLIAGVKGDVDLAKFKATYDDLIALNGSSDTILAFYRTLNGDTNRDAVDKAANVQELIARDPLYAPYAELLTRYPGLLKSYQLADRSRSLPLGVSAQASQAAALYALLNRETDSAKIVGANGVADLLQGTLGGSAYAEYAALDQQYPRVFADYRARRSRGARPEGLTPIVLSDALGDVTARVVAADAVGAGNILTFGSSIQTYGNGQLPDSSCKGQCAGQGDIDLWAPGGNIIAGLTTPTAGTTIGVVTNGGGAIRSVVSGDFTINQGKVLTTQGGDILLYSSGGSIDAGRGARTSISTPPPTRTPITVDGVIVGYLYTVPASSSGSGIQTLSSDPDGIGPRTAAPAGGIYLFAPAGAIDAGEAGIRSGGSLFINAQTVLNASNFSAAGPSAGVPVATAGSLATSLAGSGTANNSKSAEDAAAAATNAARAAAAAEGLQKPSILTVEVLGFGDKNCKEQDKGCLAK
ncbi:MAG: filamentous hemagglutinin family protein [Burkholderiales bacterium]